MKEYRFIRGIGAEVRRAAKEICRDYERGYEPDEEAVNVTLKERLKREIPERIAERLDSSEKRNIQIFARVLSSRGEGSEESEVGADLGVVYQSDLPNHRVSKGLLLQSKTCRPGPRSTNCNTQLLSREVKNMLEQSSDSFVLLFPLNKTIQVFPALEIDALDNLSPNFPEKIYGKEIGRFFQEFSECFIGDHEIVPEIHLERDWSDKISLIENTFFEELGLEKVLFMGLHLSNEMLPPG